MSAGGKKTQTIVVRDVPVEDLEMLRHVQVNVNGAGYRLLTVAEQVRAMIRARASLLRDERKARERAE